METIIAPIDRNLIIAELSEDKLVKETSKGDNLVYEVTAHNSPNVMLEIGRLRELSFRVAGGGTGKEVDIDAQDTDKNVPYRQLIVWNPRDKEIVGGYRYILGAGLTVDKLSSSSIFNFSDKFVKEYLPYTIELGRSFIQPNYQSLNINRKSIYALDNLWDGLGSLIVKYPAMKYFFGKVTMYISYHQSARNMLLYFLHKYFPDNDALLEPKKSFELVPEIQQYDNIFTTGNYKEDLKILQRELRALGENIPPLINSYMNISPSMRVFGTAINPHFGGVEETGILVTIQDMYKEKITRHLNPLHKALSTLLKKL